MERPGFRTSLISVTWTSILSAFATISAKEAAIMWRYVRYVRDFPATRTLTSVTSAQQYLWRMKLGK
ncbi:hypothetical protein ACJMK2_023315 [Sinanodonta woodiana]|uniref:Secreted protein n=1 Tax=Sinanodonta woodiana TaxID=1069815 RepID=A0ABD3T5E8_SINWO